MSIIKRNQNIWLLPFYGPTFAIYCPALFASIPIKQQKFRSHEYIWPKHFYDMHEIYPPFGIGESIARKAANLRDDS